MVEIVEIGSGLDGGGVPLFLGVGIGGWTDNLRYILRLLICGFGDFDLRGGLEARESKILVNLGSKKGRFMFIGLSLFKAVTFMLLLVI